jgi:hypothetical protein
MSDSAPAGGRKFFLVPPDTYELLIKHFDEIQRVKEDPSVKIGLDLQKKIAQLKYQAEHGEIDPNRAHLKLNALLAEQNQEIMQVYKTGEFCQEERPMAAAIEETPKIVPTEKTMPMIMPPPVPVKKRKWVPFLK